MMRILAAALALLGLSACATLPPEGPGTSAPSPLGSPFSDDHYAGGGSAPLVLDLTDRGFGTTVTFERLPTAREIQDIAFLGGAARAVVVLPAWPADYAPLEGLKFPPEGVDIIVVLRGYPPSRGAAELWNLLGAPVRLVLLVPGPPTDPGVIQDLNVMRNLDRVIAEMDVPARTGFERLQRPLSFRKVVR